MSIPVGHGRWRALATLATPASLVILGILIILGVLTAGCATTSEPAELVSARIAYARASRGPAAQLAPSDLRKAKGVLEEAEQAFQNGGELEKTIDLAYVAARTAQTAEAHAQSVIAEEKTAKAKQDFGAKQDEMLWTLPSQTSR